MSKYGKVKLRNGKFYVDGQGTIVQVRFDRPGEDYPFTDSRGHRLMEDGRYIPEDDQPVSIYSIVREFRGFDPKHAASFLHTVVVNMYNLGLDDRQFRDFIRDSIAVVERKPEFNIQGTQTGRYPGTRPNKTREPT